MFRCYTIVLLLLQTSHVKADKSSWVSLSLKGAVLQLSLLLLLPSRLCLGSGVLPCPIWGVTAAEQHGRAAHQVLQGMLLSIIPSLTPAALAIARQLVTHSEHQIPSHWPVTYPAACSHFFFVFPLVKYRHKLLETYQPYIPQSSALWYSSIHQDQKNKLMVRHFIQPENSVPGRVLKRQLL